MNGYVQRKKVVRPSWIKARSLSNTVTIALLFAGLAFAPFHARAQTADADKYTIQLQSRAFTPEAGVPADLTARIGEVIARTPTETDIGKPRAHVLIQLKDPPESADRERLAEQGITLLMPVNKTSWYAGVTAAGAENIRKIDDIRWGDLLNPEDKLAATIQKDQPFNYQMRTGDRVAYSVLFHKDVSAQEVLALSERLGGTLEDFDANAFPVVRTVTMNIALGDLLELAKEDIVVWIEPASPPDEDHNLLNAQPLSNVDDAQAFPFNLDGTGVTVGLWEAGDVVQAALLDLTPRLIVQAGQTAGSDDHAAHVAGTIGASGVNVVNAEGMAPNVTIASWDAANDAAEMVNAVTSPGGAGQPTPIQISNHSYGPGIGWNGAGNAFTNNQNQFGLYNNRSQAWDNIVFQNGLIVSKSAGNDRNDAPAAPVAGQPADCFQGGLGVAADCIGPPGTAKNIITVGAMTGAAGIAAFSSFGPTDDGRIKPDLVAHGFNLLSLACNCFDDRDGDGVDDVPDSLTASRTMQGTSMSTPVVSGVSALVLQEAGRLGIGITPSAMKALLVQTAQDVQGIGQSRPGPDYATGWGIVDAEAAVGLLRQSGLALGTLTGTGIGNAWTTTFLVPAGQQDVQVTLAWDDPAGTPGGQILINDLDLRLIDPNGTVFTPWILNPALPGQAAVENGGNDAANNVEQVSAFVVTPGTPTPGIWTAQVSANAGNLPLAPQAFAIAGVGLAPQIQIPGDIDFGDSCTGSTASETLNVCNTGTGDLAVDTITSPSPEFFVTTPLPGGYPVTINPGACFPFQARFQPTAAGPRSSVLTIPSNDGFNPSVDVNVSGIGTEQNIAVTGSTDFGTVSAWSAGERSVEVCNIGACDLTVNSASVDCPDFTIVGTPFPATLSSAACTNLTTKFTPTVPGLHSCTLSVNSDDPDTPVVDKTLTARTPPAFSIHAGVANAKGALNNTNDDGLTINFDFVRDVNQNWAWDVRMGVSKLDGKAPNPDIDVWTIASNARYTFNPISPFRLFANGGLGLYQFDPGDLELGANLGLGIRIPINPRFGLEATYNYHNAFTASPDLKFDQIQLGLLISF